MTTVHHAHQRTSPPHVKKTATRAQRPAPLTKTFSATKVALKSPKGIKAGSSSSEPSTEQSKYNVVDNDDDDDSMATSFLQFCAMCEKQIVVPNNSILYCSESCRRKDACKVPTESLYSTGQSQAHQYETSEDDTLEFKHRDIIPRRQPSVLPPSLLNRIPPVLHTAKSDLDPTEWKPKLEHRPTSEAFQYLSQFHRSTSSLGSGNARPKVQQSRNHNPGLLSQTAPSLSHTPTTTSTASSDGSLAGTPYEFATRPLAPRHDSAMYSASAAPKSVELITPIISACSSMPLSGAATAKPKGKKAATATASMAENMTYEKKWHFGTADQLSGSLKKLLYLQSEGGTARH
ncbi:hypothetical protein MMC09_006146 [Bachmanniomyces sp. S44760]|nr:hypothetical protein [Bachmanniomyces sp. S44760]